MSYYVSLLTHHYFFHSIDCYIRPPLQAPVMQHSMSSPADMLFNSHDGNSNIHPLYSTATAPSTPSILDTKSMTSLPMPVVSSSSSTNNPSSSAFYFNHSSSKSMVQVGQLPKNDPIFPTTTVSPLSASTSASSTSIRRNKTLPSKRSTLPSAASTSTPSLPSTEALYLPPSHQKQPSWLERSTSTSIIRRERQQSMPMANQKAPVRRWKSIRTVPTMERDDLTTPIFTQ